MGDRLPEGNGGPRRELARRLEDAMRARGVSRAELARRAALGKATVSDALNPARGAPLANTVDQFAKALGISGDALVELQRLRDQADSRLTGPESGRMLACYIDAARRAAMEHPYAGILPGTIPSLRDVYLRQQVHVVDPWPGRGPEADREVSRVPTGPIPAEQALARDRPCGARGTRRR